MDAWDGKFFGCTSFFPILFGLQDLFMVLPSIGIAFGVYPVYVIFRVFSLQEFSPVPTLSHHHFPKVNLVVKFKSFLFESLMFAVSS